MSCRWMSVAFCFRLNCHQGSGKTQPNIGVAACMSFPPMLPHTTCRANIFRHQKGGMPCEEHVCQAYSNCVFFFCFLRTLSVVWFSERFVNKAISSFQRGNRKINWWIVVVGVYSTFFIYWPASSPQTIRLDSRIVVGMWSWHLMI